MFGAGFIGSHIVDRLVDMDHDVIVIDDESAEANGEFYYNDKATYVKESIVNYDKILLMFSNTPLEFHVNGIARVLHKACPYWH